MIGFDIPIKTYYASALRDAFATSLSDLEAATEMRFYDCMDSLITLSEHANKRSSEYDKGANSAAWLLMIDDIDKSLSPRDWLFIK